MNWANVHIIAAIFLGASARVSRQNPNGWTTPGSDAAIAAQVTEQAVRAKARGATACIIWDPNGYHITNCNYLGDPTIAPAAPNTAALVPAEMAAIARLGLIPGCCLRPTAVVQTASGAYWQAEVDIGGIAHMIDVAQAAERMGAQAFYVDSNVSALYGPPVMPQGDWVIPGATASGLTSQLAKPPLIVWEHQTGSLAGWGGVLVDARDKHGQEQLKAASTSCFPYIIDEADLGEAERKFPLLAATLKAENEAALKIGNVKLIHDGP